MMFWIIVMAVIFIAGIVMAIKEREWVDILIGIVINLGVLVVALVMCVCIGSLIPADEVYAEDEMSILALADDPGVSGHTYFLGGSNVKSDMYYYYIVPEDDGGRVLKKVKSEDATLYDTERGEPHIAVCHCHNANPVVRFFFVTEQDKYKIYIPEGSIKYDFAVDLE